MSQAPPVKDKLVEEFANLYAKQLKKWEGSVKNSSPSDRIKKLKRLRKWMMDNQQLIRDAVYQDFRKPKTEADLSEVLPVVSEINHTIANLHDWMRPQPVETPLTMLGTSGKIVRESKGVVLIIAPWNYPFMLGIGPLVSAIAAGCCVVMKPSEMTPNTSELIQKMAAELFEEDEFAVRQGDASVAQALLKQPFRHIFFTGSPQVGKIIMKAAAEHLASVTLELGGENPVIVDETANLKDAADKLIWGKFLNYGQSCMSPNYVMVHRTKKKDFLERLKTSMASIYGDDPSTHAATPDMARKVNLGHFNRVKGLIEDAKLKGGSVLFGDQYQEEECFIAPTVLVDVPEEARARNEEIFGPVLQVLEYENLDEVIRYINAKPNPLGLYIFSKSRKNIDKVTAQTHSGTMAVNETTLPFIHTGLPFGGNGVSGIGKAHGFHGFMAFTNEKAWLKQRIGITSGRMFYPPFTDFKQKLVNFVIKWLA